MLSVNGVQKKKYLCLQVNIGLCIKLVNQGYQLEHQDVILWKDTGLAYTIEIVENNHGLNHPQANLAKQNIR